MPGSWNHDAPLDRCVFAANYGAVKGIDHPKAVYIRESAIVPRLDEWLASLFDPQNLDLTCKQLGKAGDPDEGRAARLEAAQRKLEDCDRRLAKYRGALEADADPVVVAGWTTEVKGVRIAAERELAGLSNEGPLTVEEIRALVLALKDIPKVLADADPKLKAKIYAELGIRIIYEPGSRVVVAEARPTCTTGGVGGAFATMSTPALWRTEWAA